MLLTDLVIVSLSWLRISSYGEVRWGWVGVEEKKIPVPLIPQLAILCRCFITMKEKKGKRRKKKKNNPQCRDGLGRPDACEQIESIYLSVPELLIPVQLFV